jgi:CRISPR-associated endonuclease Csn1
MSTSLGLDIGANSIGWALVQIDGDTERSVIAAGVRVFPEGVDRDTKGLEQSKNEQRRVARGVRRILDRRRRRRRKLVAILQSEGLFPTTADHLTQLWKSDPYKLRTKALKEPLPPLELGRVLFHLNQRRGFKSNRKTGRVKEDGKVHKGATDLQTAITQAGAHTLGEYLHRAHTNGVRIRGQYTLRRMYEEEFDALWTAQQPHHREILTDELKKRLREETIFFQRPLKPADHLIGKCPCEPAERRCPRADWHAQQFRVLKEVNNLTIRSPDGGEQNLTSDQRKKLVQTLGTKKDMTFDQMRTLLDLLEHQTFNLEEGPRGGRGDAKTKRAKLKGNTIEAAIVKAFGSRWPDLPDPAKETIRAAVVETEEADALRVLAVQEWGLAAKQVDALLAVDLPDGYAAYSLKAIQNMLPYLEQGMKEYEARERAGYTVDALAPAADFLPLPERDGKPLVNNPIVRRALYEVRKVVNAVIREYGKPDRMIVEMVRDMTRPAKDREAAVRRIKHNESEREQARTVLEADFHVPNPKGPDIFVYRLWKQQKESCPYTGRQISPDHLRLFFAGEGILEIDHILPYSRSLDDSQSNKCLCFAEANREKKDRTPREWREGTPEYEQMLQRVASLKETGMLWGKRRKFSQQEVELDKFIARQLNDTAYIAREARTYLETLYAGDRYERDQRVRTTRGQVTGDLRHHWGLNSVLDKDGSLQKNRQDHRHHAIDAVVTALTTHKRLNTLSRTDRALGTARQTLPDPWPGFRDEVNRIIQGINVSHRVARKVAGALHEGTNYGPTEKPNEFVYRVPVNELTGAMVEKIRDPIIRAIIEQRARERCCDPPTLGSKKFPAAVFPDTDPPKMPSGVPIRHVRILTTLGDGSFVKLDNPDGHKGYRAVKLGSNHHIEIIETTDKKGRSQRLGKVVSTFEAAQRIRRRQPIIQRDHGPDSKFIMSLSINEMFLLQLQDGSEVLHRVQKLSEGGIVLRPHNYAGKVSGYDRPPQIQRRTENTLRGRKVAVDPLGRIQDAND